MTFKLGFEELELRDSTNYMEDKIMMKSSNMLLFKGKIAHCLHKFFLLGFRIANYDNCKK